jgi:hypothetical protein
VKVKPGKKLCPWMHHHNNHVILCCWMI